MTLNVNIGRLPYGNGSEEMIGNSPERRGLWFTIVAYCDADHAGDLMTRRSRTGFIVYVNNSPIFWMSKKQTSIETSSYGSEFIAMKHCCEYMKGLRYKLSMMGIPCNGHCFIYGDNTSVLVNATVPHSTLQKEIMFDCLRLHSGRCVKRRVEDFVCSLKR